MSVEAPDRGRSSIVPRLVNLPAPILDENLTTPPSDLLSARVQSATQKPVEQIQKTSSTYASDEKKKLYDLYEVTETSISSESPSSSQEFEQETEDAAKESKKSGSATEKSQGSTKKLVSLVMHEITPEVKTATFYEEKQVLELKRLCETELEFTLNLKAWIFVLNNLARSFYKKIQESDPTKENPLSDFALLQNNESLAQLVSLGLNTLREEANPCLSSQEKRHLAQLYLSCFGIYKTIVSANEWKKVCEAILGEKNIAAFPKFLEDLNRISTERSKIIKLWRQKHTIFETVKSAHVCDITIANLCKVLVRDAKSDDTEESRVLDMDRPMLGAPHLVLVKKRKKILKIVNKPPLSLSKWFSLLYSYIYESISNKECSKVEQEKVVAILEEAIQDENKVQNLSKTLRNILQCMYNVDEDRALVLQTIFSLGKIAKAKIFRIKNDYYVFELKLITSQERFKRWCLEICLKPPKTIKVKHHVTHAFALTIFKITYSNKKLSPRAKLGASPRDYTKSPICQPVPIAYVDWRCIILDANSGLKTFRLKIDGIRRVHKIRPPELEGKEREDPEKKKQYSAVEQELKKIRPRIRKIQEKISTWSYIYSQGKVTLNDQTTMMSETKVLKTKDPSYFDILEKAIEKLQPN